MQYLMVDLHQRFVGTVERPQPLTVGEAIEADAKSYVVVGIDPTGKQRNRPVPTLTVMDNRAGRRVAVAR
ncbi:MAG: hypothetical protein HC918_01720 [Oscillatoriales cyanobacterium SM2_1_8]|nr:hypothetical protein [Oscillatoriales cyanobacterium SM2_1_8]